MVMLDILLWFQATYQASLGTYQSQLDILYTGQTYYEMVMLGFAILVSDQDLT